MKKIAINGALGKMGRTIARLLKERSGLELSVAFDVQAPGEGAIAGIPADMLFKEVTKEKLSLANVIIDFSVPAATMPLLQFCLDTKTPIVIGTTGFNSGEEKIIFQASSVIPVLKSSNMSIGVNMLFALAGIAARALKGRGFQPEMMEIHHKNKVDSPSGTARSLEKIILENMLPEGSLIHGREGIIGARKDNELGSMALRGGDVVGDHTVFFLGDGERIELKHQATTRDVFAKGAIDAASFLCDQKPGMYTMADVLRL